MTREAARFFGVQAAAIGLLGLCFSGPGWAADRGADGQFDKRESSHFVLYQDVDIDQTSGFHGSRRFEQEVLAALESAYQDADRVLGLRSGSPITVIIYDPAVFDRKFSGLFKYPAAGFYGGRVHIRGDQVVSDRLVRVLYHELAHASLDHEISGLVLPGWFNEGLAEWFEVGGVSTGGIPFSGAMALRQASETGTLPSLASLSSPAFGALGPDQARLAYLRSHAFIAYLARNHGGKRVRDWIREVARTKNLDRSTRRIFKADLHALEARQMREWAGAPP